MQNGLILCKTSFLVSYSLEKNNGSQGIKLGGTDNSKLYVVVFKKIGLTHCRTSSIMNISVGNIFGIDVVCRRIKHSIY